MTIIMGVDPGQTGALAFIEGSEIVKIHDMPILDKQVDVNHVASLLHTYTPTLVAIELLHAMPGGSARNWSLAWNTSAVETTVTLVGHRLVRIAPREWKKEFKLNGKQKGASRLVAMQLWPDSSESFARVKHDGRADACLIAEAARRWNL